MAFDGVDQQLSWSATEGVWELFHENSKMCRHERHSVFPLPPSDAQVVLAMNRLHTVKPYRDFAKVELPESLPSSVKPFDRVLLDRVSAREFGPGGLRLAELAKILHMGYGITRDNVGTAYSRPFRAVPSGGALYPLEVYVSAARVGGLEPGLYHYDPESSMLDVLRRGDEGEAVASCLFQQELGRQAAAVLFVSAVFLRSTFKYGDRGYRFALIEAGHLGQNVVLTALELDLAAAPVGGYLDREVDAFLGLDGLEESVLYVILLGQPAACAAPT